MRSEPRNFTASSKALEALNARSAPDGQGRLR